MKTKLSGLIDGELDTEEARALFDALKQEKELRGCWREYLLIGDALKGEKCLDVDLTAKIMDSLRDEPIVLVPKASERTSLQRTVLALAATVAGIAVVGWVALGPQGGQPPVQTLALQGQPIVQPVRQVSRDMRDYLAAHQAQSSSLQFRGGTEHIRTVVASGMMTSK